MQSEFTSLYSVYFISSHLLFFFGHARASLRWTDISLHFYQKKYVLVSVFHEEQ